MTYQMAPPGHSVTKGTGRERTRAPTFEANGGGAADDRTKFTDSGADFQAYMVGWGREATAPQVRNAFRGMQPDVELPSYLEIIEVDESSGNWVRVKGDADTLATSGSTYRLHAPPGVDRETGALITGLEEAGSHWLWAGYEYVPPMVGFHNPEGQDPGTYGAQSGGNKLGSYHCWNRVYDIHTGRWTTPDPAMSPWTNTTSYGRPTSQLDPTGLMIAPPPSSHPKGPQSPEWPEQFDKKHTRARGSSPYAGPAIVGHLDLKTASVADTMAFLGMTLPCCPPTAVLIQGSDDYTELNLIATRKYTQYKPESEVYGQIDSIVANAWDWIAKIEARFWAQENVPIAMLAAIVSQHEAGSPHCAPGCTKHVSLLAWNARSTIGDPIPVTRKIVDPSSQGETPRKMIDQLEIYVPITWTIDYTVAIQCWPSPTKEDVESEEAF